MPVVAKIAIVGVLGLLAGLLISDRKKETPVEPKKTVEFVAAVKPAKKKAEVKNENEGDDENDE